MTATDEQPVVQRERPCGYSGCDRTIPYSGRGRPREYCDRVWPDGETCQQKAEQQRSAAKAAGLDGPLVAYRQVAEATRPALEAVQAQVSELLASLRAVEAGALDRITAAEAAAVAAEERAQQAEHDRDTAVSRAGVADQQRREAVEAQRVAERRARDAEKDAEDTKVKAWREIADHDHKRGKAEAARDEAQANLKALKERFDRLADEVNELRTTNKDLTKQAAAAEKAQAVAEAAQRAAENAQATAEAARDEAIVKRDEAADKATAATTRAEQAEAEQTRLRDELATAQQTVREQQDRAAGAEAERDQLTSRLTAAEQRVDERDAEIARLRDEAERVRSERDQAQARADASPTHEQIAEMIRAAVQPPAADEGNGPQPDGSHK